MEEKRIDYFITVFKEILEKIEVEPTPEAIERMEKLSKCVREKLSSGEEDED